MVLLDCSASARAWDEPVLIARIIDRGKPANSA
jgi:hypothetical protein